MIYKTGYVSFDQQIAKYWLIRDSILMLEICPNPPKNVTIESRDSVLEGVYCGRRNSYDEDRNVFYRPYSTSTITREEVKKYLHNLRFKEKLQQLIND